MARHVAIVGGGATGLAAAYMAMKRGYKVTLIDRAPEWGGLLQTFPIEGTRLEHYYHHFFTHDQKLLWLLKELGLESELEFFNGSMGILRHGKIHDFNSVPDLFRFSPLNTLDRARFLATSLYLGKVANWKHYENTSAVDWFQKYAGSGVVDNIWSPLLKSKFNHFYKDIPLSWMVGRLSQRMNSRKGAQEKLGYLKGSLDILLQKLLHTLRQGGVDMKGSCSITGLSIKDQRIQSLQTSEGTLTADDFIFTVPTSVLSKMFQTDLPAYAEELNRIYYLGAMCLILELERPMNPIYWMNIADPGYSFTGVIEHTNLVPSSYYRGKSIAYLSRYFDPNQDEIASLPRVELENRMLGDLEKMFPTFQRKTVLHTHLFKSHTAATLCDLNFSQKVPSFQGPLQNMYVANMAHVYPDERSLNNSIRVASQCFAHLK